MKTIVLCCVATALLATAAARKRTPPEEYKGDVIEAISSQPDDVMALMQNVLCRNFPTVPCDIIRQDNKLNKLIALSIKQISRATLPKPRPPHYNDQLPLFPTVDSEDLSNFLDVQQTGYFPNDFRHRHMPDRKKKVAKKNVTNPKVERNAKKLKKQSNNRKFTKYYPHKNTQSARAPPQTNRRSTVLEKNARPNRFKSYMDPTIWRIDYVNDGNTLLPLDDLAHKIIRSDHSKQPSVFMNDDSK